MSFSDEEIAYLRSQPLTRLATVGPDGQPDVVPLAFEFDGGGFWVGGVGDAVARTRCGVPSAATVTNRPWWWVAR
jgi:pyridoxamine 5'-phosphate oxidase family protein